MKPFIPISEDDPDIAESIRYNLERDGSFVAQAAITGEEGPNMAMGKGPWRGDPQSYGKQNEDTTVQTHLFIGGAQDGLNIPVADDMGFVQLPVGAIGQETYIRDTLSVGYESFVFYRHENLTPEQVLDLLAKHYTAWAVNRTARRG